MSTFVSALRSPNTWRWLDLVLFKLSWGLLVIFQDKAVLPVLGIIALKIVSWAELDRWLGLVVLTIILGLGIDLSLSLASVFIFPDTLMPLWLVMLWISFALTLPRGLAFLVGMHPLAQAAVGMAAGCGGYLAGRLMGAVSFGYSLPLTLALLALIWALLLPGLFALENLLQSGR